MNNCVNKKYIVKSDSVFMINLIPRVLSYLPYGARERDPGKRWSCASQKLGDLQTNDLGEGQVSVRFVFTECRQVSAAMKLCT